MSPSSRTVRKFNLDEFQPSTFLKNNNITVTFQKGSRGYEWIASDLKSCTNASINSFNDIVDNSIMDNEVNACGIFEIHTIENTVDND